MPLDYGKSPKKAAGTLKGEKKLPSQKIPKKKKTSNKKAKQGY